jgi:hypothetical protein
VDDAARGGLVSVTIKRVDQTAGSGCGPGLDLGDGRGAALVELLAAAGRDRAHPWLTLFQSPVTTLSALRPHSSLLLPAAVLLLLQAASSFWFRYSVRGQTLEHSGSASLAALAPAAALGLLHSAVHWRWSISWSHAVGTRCPPAACCCCLQCTRWV